MRRPRIRLTDQEIETILAVAGDALASETLADPDERKHASDLAAFERGMDKLRAILASRTDYRGADAD